MKTVTQIVELLSDQIDKINADQISPQKANAVCNSVGKIIGAVRLQFDFCRMTGTTPKLPLALLEAQPTVVGKGKKSSLRDE